MAASLAAVTRTHHDQRLDFLKEVLVCVGTQSSLTPFHFVGDWNDEPHEAPLEWAGARVVATEQPTRWGGKRYLDNMITNVPAVPGIEEIKAQLPSVLRPQADDTLVSDSRRTTHAMAAAGHGPVPDP